MNKFILIILGMLLFTAPLLAGDLDDFEKDVTDKEETDEETKDDEEDEITSDTDNDESSPFCSFIAELIFRLIGYTMLHGGVESWNMVSPDNALVLFKDEAYYKNIRHRYLGESIIPFVKTEIKTQYINQDLTGIHGLAELGFGPFGIQYEHLHFLEFNPQDTLIFDKAGGYYRMVFLGILEIDLGGGYIIMEGNDTYSGGFLSFPLHLSIGSIMAIEMKQEFWFINRLDILNHSLLSLHFCLRYLTFHFGYEWIQAPTTGLNGIVLGFSFRL